MIIGLVGFIGAGKGTVADLLVDRHDFVKESFASSVKDSVSAVFGWDRSLLEGDTAESRAWRETPDKWWSEKLGKTFSPRLALQLMGTEAGRDVFHEDLWVHTLMRRCENAPNKNYVIADVRFSINSNRVINRAELSLIIADKIAEENLGHWLVLFEQNKIPAGAVNSISEVFALNAANKKILEQEEDGRISKRVETIAFTIQYGN